MEPDARPPKRAAALTKYVMPLPDVPKRHGSSSGSRSKGKGKATAKKNADVVEKKAGSSKRKREEDEKRDEGAQDVVVKEEKVVEKGERINSECGKGKRKPAAVDDEAVAVEVATTIKPSQSKRAKKVASAAVEVESEKKADGESEVKKGKRKALEEPVVLENVDEDDVIVANEVKDFPKLKKSRTTRPLPPPPADSNITLSLESQGVMKTMLEKAQTTLLQDCKDKKEKKAAAKVVQDVMEDMLNLLPSITLPSHITDREILDPEILPEKISKANTLIEDELEEQRTLKLELKKGKK